MVSARVVSVLESLFGGEVQNSSQAFNRLSKGKLWLSRGQPPSKLMASSFLEGARTVPQCPLVLPRRVFLYFSRQSWKISSVHVVPKRTLKCVFTQSHIPTRCQSGDWGLNSLGSNPMLFWSQVGSPKSWNNKYLWPREHRCPVRREGRDLIGW